MHTRSERYRIFLSRGAAVMVLFLVVGTDSYWSVTNHLLAPMLFCTGIVLVGIASLGRMWCSLYIAGYKDNRLVKEGPYSLCRNPLYFFSMAGAIGIGCASKTLTLPIIFMLLFAVYYPYVMKGEASRLRELFGVEYDEYAKRVPIFFPRFSTFFEPETYVVRPDKYRYHIFSAIWFIWLVGILEAFEGLKEIGVLPSLWSLY